MEDENRKFIENWPENRGKQYEPWWMKEEITKNLGLCDEDWNCILMDCWEFDEDEKKTFQNCEIYLKKFKPETIKIFEQIFQENKRNIIQRADKREMLVGDRQDSEVTKKELRLGMRECKNKNIKWKTYLKRIIGSLFHKIKEKIASLSPENQKKLVKLRDSSEYLHQDKEFQEIYQLFSLYNQIRDFLKELYHKED